MFERNAGYLSKVGHVECVHDYASIRSYMSAWSIVQVIFPITNLHEHIFEIQSIFCYRSGCSQSGRLLGCIASSFGLSISRPRLMPM